MNRLSVIALLVAAALPTIGAAADPVVTDSRLINEERRVQILEAKLA